MQAEWSAVTGLCFGDMCSQAEVQVMSIRTILDAISVALYRTQRKTERKKIREIYGLFFKLLENFPFPLET